MFHRWVKLRVMSTTEPMLVKRSTVSRYPFMSRARLTIREHTFITLIAQRYEVDYSRALRIVLRDAIERLGEPERAALEAAAVAVADELNRTGRPTQTRSRRRCRSRRPPSRCPGPPGRP